MVAAGEEGVVGLAELRDVAPGGVAGVEAGDMRSGGPVAGGLRMLAVMECVEYCDVRESIGTGSTPIPTLSPIPEEDWD